MFTPALGPWDRCPVRTFNGTSQWLTYDRGLGVGATAACWVSIWVWLNALGGTAQALFSLGVNGSSNNRRDVVYLGTTTEFQVRSVSNSGTASAVSVSATGLSGQWIHIYGGWESTTARRIIVTSAAGTLSAFSNTSNTVSVAPNQIRVGATPTGSALLDGRVGLIAFGTGILAADLRGPLAAGIYPGEIDPPKIAEIWNPTTVGPVVGQWRQSVLEPTGNGELAVGPFVQQPPVLARRPVGGFVAAAVGNPWFAYAQMRR